VTSARLKVVGLAAVGLAACAAARGHPGPARPASSAAAVVAGSANLLNLLDLRPGRALKAGAARRRGARPPGTGRGGRGAAAGRPRGADDARRRRRQRLGALLGLALLQHAPQRRGAALGVLAALTLASEVVSYSRVIDAVPPLRWVDRAGRRP
jgi:hypothetical protein